MFYRVMKTNAPEKIYVAETTFPDYVDFDESPINTKKIDDIDIEYTRTDAFINKACEAFCKATCNGNPPRSTCTSLGTCKEYDNFVKFMKRE